MRKEKKGERNEEKSGGKRKDRERKKEEKETIFISSINCNLVFSLFLSHKLLPLLLTFETSVTIIPSMSFFLSL